MAAAIVLGLVSLGAASAPGGPAGQNQNPAVGAPPAPAGALSLVTQSAFVRATENFILCVRVDGLTDPSQVELAVTTYQRIENPGQITSINPFVETFPAGVTSNNHLLWTNLAVEF